MNLLGQILVAVAPALVRGIARAAIRLATNNAHRFESDVCAGCGCDLRNPQDKRWSQPCANAGA